MPKLARFESPKFKMTQKVVVMDIFRLPKSLTTPEKITIVNDFTSSAFVRHPFVRLVSAFIDKIVDNNYKNWRKLVNYNKRYKIKVRKLLLSSVHSFLPVQAISSHKNL